jgi:phosphoribosylformimino-5-aminoimidazole carboxamide ribotide isomerase
MRLIPVLDVLHGVVVRGVGGRRSEYRPIVSQLTSSTDPVEVARALVEHIRPAELYLADLDAIQGRPPASAVYHAIRGLGVSLWVDAGVADAAGARAVAATGCDVVAGLETVPGPEALGEIVNAVGAANVVFSLDLRDGVPLREWVFRGDRSLTCPGLVDRSETCPHEAAIGLGITRLIVLDLARVGGGAGTGTDDLCREIASTYPHVEVIAGGGVAGPDHLRRLEAVGVRGALVASALHDGRLGPATCPGG